MEVGPRKALTAEQSLSPLVGRPYDLRHAAVSLWLNGGVAATEVARRAGHSVAALLRVYASCIDGEEPFTRHTEFVWSLASEYAGQGRFSWSPLDLTRTRSLTRSKSTAGPATSQPGWRMVRSRGVTMCAVRPDHGYWNANLPRVHDNISGPSEGSRW